MNYENDFVAYLVTLSEDRGALAALRRGLGQPPGTVPDMFRYVVPRLPQKVYPGSWAEKSHYLIASLFGLHPVCTSRGNLGVHFAKLRDPDPKKNDALERRFAAILTAHPEDLHIYLRQAISFLKSNDENPVNWHALMWDVLVLDNPDRATQVQKRWAEGFWRYQGDLEENINA
jgi:CRISPR system Cascade subunit CasB